jgi:transcriptional regulator with GAF, ATPase, and Fis domain
MSTYAPAGIMAVIVAGIYMLLTIGMMVAYRRQIDPLILVGIVVLLAGQNLAILDPRFRRLDVATLFSVVATLILGYRLARMQLFNPLRMHWTQLTALQEMIRALTGKQDEAQLYGSIAQQARIIMSADIATLVIRRVTESSEDLLIAAQDGGPQGIAGRVMPSESGLSGRIFQARRPFRLQNYSTWENKAPALSDVKMYVMGVPLTYDDELLGVVLVAELKPGRAFSERDQALLEMLAQQAALALMNSRLHQQIAALLRST